MAFVADEEVPQAPSRFKSDEPVSKPLPANAGLANFGASVVGLPVDTVQNVMNLGRAAVGTAATAAGRPDLAPDLQQGAVGGSEWLKAKLRQSGLPGLSPDNPSPDSKMGTAQYDLVSRGGFTPGGVVPAVGSMIAEKVGGPEWAGVGGMAPSVATQAYNAARAPALAREQAQNQVRDRTLQPAQDAGYVLPPSAIRPTAAGNVVESFAGKSAIKQESELKNQQVTNRLVREELRLPENAPLTEQSLNAAREQAAAPYRAVAAISPMAAGLLQRLREVRADATAQWRHYDMQGVPEAQARARALDTQATTLERVIERQVSAAGHPELVQELRAARTYIAKTYDVERALNVGNGNVDARIIGRAIDRGRPLTGNLETIGRFSEAYPQFSREASRVPNPGTSALNVPAAAILAEEGARHFGPYGLAAAAIPFARGGVRQGLLSDYLQQNFNRPDYTPNVMPQGGLQAMIQQAIIANQKRQ